MICPACGKDNETGESRCGRCGRRFDTAAREPAALQQSDPAPVRPLSGSGAASAAALAPQWKSEVNERLEQFRQKRARRRLPPRPGDESEEVPRPDKSQKLLSFEDFAADRIEPLIVERSTPSRDNVTQSSRTQEPPSRILPPLDVPRARGVPGEGSALPDARERSGEFQPDRRAAGARLTGTSDEAGSAPFRSAATYAPGDILCPRPVAPVMLRTLAGLLDLSLVGVGLGIFFTTFQLLGGAFHLSKRAGAGLFLAAALVGAFYFFLYIFYAVESPGLQWVGLCILDYDGNPPTGGQRLMRAMGALLSAAALGLGYLWALADEEGLTWHDRMSRTFVTRDLSASRVFRAVSAAPPMR